MQTGFIASCALPARRGRAPTPLSSAPRHRPSVAARPRRARAPRMAASVLVTADTFSEQVLQSDLPVVVYFGAPWCGPCKLTAPLMEWAASEYEGRLKVAKIDTDKTDTKIVDFPIYGLPTLAVFKNGAATAVQEGAIGKKKLTEYIEENAITA